MRKEFGKNGGKERPMSEALVTVQISFIHDRLCAIVKPVQLMCRMKRSAGWMANDTRTNETHSIRAEKVCYGSFFSRSSLLLARLPNLVFMIHGLCTVGFVACSLAYLLAVVKRLNWHIDLYKHHNRLTMEKKRRTILCWAAAEYCHRSVCVRINTWKRPKRLFSRHEIPMVLLKYNWQNGWPNFHSTLCEIRERILFSYAFVSLANKKWTIRRRR